MPRCQWRTFDGGGQCFKKKGHKGKHDFLGRKWTAPTYRGKIGPRIWSVEALVGSVAKGASVCLVRNERVSHAGTSAFDGHGTGATPPPDTWRLKITNVYPASFLQNWSGGQLVSMIRRGSLYYYEKPE